MYDPIDLDLVELRAKVRGWKCVRKRELVCVDTPSGKVEVTSSGGVYFGPGLSDRVLGAVTAPRWTLERLLSEPPEGWRVVPPADPDTAVHVLAWGDEEDAPRAAFGFVEGYGLLVSMNVRSAGRDLARLAVRHKAAAELALILAEVEP